MGTPDWQRAMNVYSGREQPMSDLGLAPGMAPAAMPSAVPYGPPTGLSGADEARFQQDMQNGDGYRQWREQFMQKNGGAPDLNDPDYDYRMAWKSGIRPAPYGHDGGAYHWASSAPNGEMLKSENHPTAWMEHFMRATGKDPNDVGVRSAEEGAAYIASGGQRPTAASPQGAALTYPSQVAELDAASAAQQQSVQTQAGIRADGAQAQTGVHEQQAHAQQAHAQNAQRMQADYAQHRQEVEGQAAQLDQEIGNTRVEDRRTTGQRIGALIAMAFAGIGDAVGAMGGHQTNHLDQTMGLIDKMVQADLDKQREALKGKRDQKTALLSGLDRARQFFGDDLKADEYVAATEKERYAGLMEAETARMNNPLIREQGAAAAAKIREETAETKLKLANEINDNTFRDKQLALQRARIGGAGGGRGKVGSEQLSELEAKEKAGKLSVDEALALKKLRATTGKGGGSGELTPYQQLQAEKMQRDRLDRVGDDLKSMTNARSAIANLSPYMADGADLPNTATGVIGSLTPDYLTSNEAKAFKGNINSFQDAFLRVASGAGVSESEALRKWSEFGMRPDLNQTEDSIRQGLKMAESQVKEWSAAIRAKDPEGYDIYEQNRRASGGSGGAKKPAGDVKQLKKQFSFTPAGK